MKQPIFSCLFVIFLQIIACDTPTTTTTNAPQPKQDAPIANDDSDSDVATLVTFINSDDIAGAQKLAKKENKVLFIDFYTTWCAPCRVMEQSVFRDQLVADYMNENCISIRVNAEKGNGPNMKIAYAVDGYPTMLFYTPGGDEVARKFWEHGYLKSLKKYMKASVWKARNPTN
ncbi:MAG: DUF255 domain-containing protein [Saprospiraceae bacterium]|nr:DUF255 domain-containing protein [Saprospiraceae bacterium]